MYLTMKEHLCHAYSDSMPSKQIIGQVAIKALSLNLALTLGCVNPKTLNPNPNNCGYDSN